MLRAKELLKNLLLAAGGHAEAAVQHLDFDSLEKVSGTYVADDLREREDDVIWRVRWGQDWLYVYLLIEFQLSVNRYFLSEFGYFLKLFNGDLVHTGGLLPSKDGVRLRLANGKITVTDGPFSESKEIIGGWAILDVPSKADAIRIATEFMELHRKHWPGFEGESEVRPMFEAGEGP